MPLIYTESTEKIAKSYQRTNAMVPNMGVSSLTVVNPGRPEYDLDLGDSSLLTPLTGMGFPGAQTRRKTTSKRRVSSRRASRRTTSRKFRTSSRRVASRRRSHI